MSYYLVNPKDQTTIYGFISNPNIDQKVKAFSYLENAVTELSSHSIQHLLDYHKCELTQNPYRDNSFVPVEKLLRRERKKVNA